MAEVKIKVEKSLGGQVAFGGKEIRVLESTYNAVPEEKRSEFDKVLIKAQERYQELVKVEKDAGRRPAASKLKAQAIKEVVDPFLEGVEVSKGKSSRGTAAGKKSEKKPSKGVVVPKKASTKPSNEDLASELDNFPAEDLDDSGKDEEVKGAYDDLDDDVDDLMDGDELIEEGLGDDLDDLAAEDAFGDDSDMLDELDLDI